jgi:phosphohistidine phosphatase
MKAVETIMPFKNIIIWRHAEAHPALAQGEEQDLARVLTPKGKQQAKRMASWLNQRLPKSALVISSPAMRAFQTAQTVKDEVKVLEALKPNANLQQVLELIASLECDKETGAESLLLIGHQPWLWRLVAHLTGFAAPEISIKKGAVWWLRLISDEIDGKQVMAGDITIRDVRYNIIAVQSPSFLT